MAVKLRLRKMGKKKQPIYKIVAADSRSPRDGKFIESIGVYNPMNDSVKVSLKEERAFYWLGVGAQPTDTVKNILSKEGILLKKDLKDRKLSDDQIAAQMDEWKKLKEAKLSSGEKKTKKRKKSAEGTQESSAGEAK